MLLLGVGPAEIHSTGRLVKASEVGQIASAEEILDAARKEAEAIRAAAQEEFNRRHEEGYEKGLKDGKAEIMMQKLDLLESSVKFMEGMEDKMAGIVIKALRKCVDQIGDEELVVQITRKAMRAVVRNQQQITVKVSPAMVPVVRARLTEIQAEFPSVNFIDVGEDAKLDDRSCVVETDAGVVDASIETQLDAIEKSIRKNFAKS